MVTIMLVEDDSALREMLSMVLRFQGFAVVAAGEYEEALSLAEGHEGTIDLLISDMVLPGGAGQDIAEIVRARRPNMHVLFMSGYDAEAIAKKLPADASFICKPFTPDELSDMVGKLLERTA